MLESGFAGSNSTPGDFVTFSGCIYPELCAPKSGSDRSLRIARLMRSVCTLCAMTNFEEPCGDVLTS